MSRRALLALGGAGVLLAACGPAATPSPQAGAQAPAKATEAPKPAAPTNTPAPAAAAKPTAAPEAPKPAEAPKPTEAAKPAAAAPATGGGAKTPLTLTVWTDDVRTWMTDRGKEFQKAHPEVDLKLESVPYADMSKKQLAYAATGTIPDVLFSGVKWAHYSAFKGVFYFIDSLVKTTNPGMDDFVPDAIKGTTFEGKLFALPFEVNSGNQNVVVYNKDLLAKKGQKEPTDDWTLEDFAKTAAALTDKPNKVWGTNFFEGTYYDFDTLSRTYGTELLTNDNKKFNLLDDPKNVDAARWHTELRTKLGAAPNRADEQGLQFAAGQIGLNCTGFYGIITATKTVGDKFKWAAVLGPTAPDGKRGYEVFVTMFSIGAKTKSPEKAYELLMYMTSKDTQLFSLAEQGQAPSRKSVWLSPQAEKISPVYARGINWLTDGKNQGPFPMPNNLRFQELEDKWENLSAPVFYGEVPFDEGIKKLQQECQAVMDQPRG